MKRPPILLPCGHFAPEGEACQICAERTSAASLRAMTSRGEVAEPDPTEGQPATAPDTDAVVGWPTDRKLLGEQPTAGVYDLPDSLYYADPLRAYGTESLSATSHRHLVAPSTPAHYRWAIDHPNDGRSDAMIFGKAFHAVALETADLAIFRDGKTWKSKAAEAFLAAHPDHGDEAPVLAGDVPAIMAMARALHEHPLASRGLRGGKAEQALFGQTDDETWVRAKLDYLTGAAGNRLILTDIKTTTCAHESEFSKSAGKYGYDLQADNCGWLAQRLKLAKHATMIFAAVESKPPYLVAVHEIDTSDLRNARAVNEAAERVFARCLATGQWPGYPVRINRIALPPWTTRAREEALYDADDEEGEDQ